MRYQLKDILNKPKLLHSNDTSLYLNKLDGLLSLHTLLRKW